MLFLNFAQSSKQMAPTNKQTIEHRMSLVVLFLLNIVRIRLLLRPRSRSVSSSVVRHEMSVSRWDPS